MTSKHALTRLLAGAALIAMGTAAAAQTGMDDYTAHHPEAVPAEPAGSGAPGAAPCEASGVMGMMTPEMMQMMMRMMSEGGMGMMDGTSGGPMAGGMRGPGMAGMGGMQVPQAGGMGGLGPEALYGMPGGAPPEMTPARVREVLTQLLESHGNPRLAIGQITESPDGSIVAEIVTRDGSLVQRLAFNRYPGLFRQLD